jgi:hypothetical protein
MPTFVVKKIVKTDIDEGENKQTERWSISCETSVSSDKITIVTDTHPNYKIGDELEFAPKSRQTKIIK